MDQEEQRRRPWRAKLQRLVQRVRRFRERIRHRRGLNTTYRVALGAFGTLVLLAGLVMIPYPGPGWLVVFAGLGILATEFHWAHRVNMFARRQYKRWVAWLGRQSWITKLAVMSGTGLVVLVTLWMMGVFGLVGSWFDLPWRWLASPLFEG